MVETPLRRSRRITRSQSQSGDEHSVSVADDVSVASSRSSRAASRRSRGESNASSTMTPTRRSARVAKKAAPAATAKTAKKRGGAKTDLDAIPEVIMMDGDGQGEDDEIVESEAPRTATEKAGGRGGKNKKEGGTEGKQKDDSADAAAVVDLSELVEVEDVEVMPVAETDTAAVDGKPTRDRKCKLSRLFLNFLLSC